MMEKELIILDIYINVGSISRQQMEQRLSDLINTYTDMYKDTNKNVKTYWFPVATEQQTRVECIYPPPNVIHNDSVIENELLKIYKLIANSKNGEAKNIIRNIEMKLKLNKIKTKMGDDEKEI